MERVLTETVCSLTCRLSRRLKFQIHFNNIPEYTKKGGGGAPKSLQLSTCPLTREKGRKCSSPWAVLGHVKRRAGVLYAASKPHGADGGQNAGQDEHKQLHLRSIVLCRDVGDPLVLQWRGRKADPPPQKEDRERQTLTKEK